MTQFIFKKSLNLQDKELERLLSEILSKLEIILQTKTFTNILLQPLDKEPEQKYNGMIVYFNNVGGKTGFYGYENGVWKKLT